MFTIIIIVFITIFIMYSVSLIQEQIILLHHTFLDYKQAQINTIC